MNVISFGDIYILKILLKQKLVFYDEIDHMIENMINAYD